MKSILVAQYRELACRCAEAIDTRCESCRTPLGTHQNEVTASGPGAEILCPRCFLLTVPKRVLPQLPAPMLEVLRLCVARHVARN
ncbi:MAG: hypothetical protein ACRD4R_06805 [Candidatus Acidiferrales bacterium]